MATVRTPELTPLQKLKAFKKINESNKFKMPVVFDTDAGHDPDDINALLSLINDDSIDLKAIVTTGEFPEIKAKILKAILAQLGRSDIPIYAGKGLYLNQIKLANGKNATTLQEALSIPEAEQIKYLEEFQSTYPGTIFKGFYPYQGKAWSELKYEEFKPDGNIGNAIQHIQKIISDQSKLNELKDSPKMLMVATGELANIEAYFNANLSKDMFVQHMGGWSGEVNAPGQKDIFPRKFLGRNLIADIKAAETVFADKNANIIIYTSHLKKQYNLEFNGDVRKLLCLIDDQFPSIKGLSDRKVNDLLMTLLRELNPVDLDAKNMENKELNSLISQLSMKAVAAGKTLQSYLKTVKSEDVLITAALNRPGLEKLIQQLLPTAGVRNLKYADKLGVALSHEYANWLAQTAFPYIICSDPGTAETAINPNLVTSEQTVSISVDSKTSIQLKEKFLSRDGFKDTVKTSPNGKVSAITGVVNRESIMQPILEKLLKHVYPGVSYQQFMTIADQKDVTIANKVEQLNKIIHDLRSKNVIANTSSLFKAAVTTSAATVVAQSTVKNMAAL